MAWEQLRSIVLANRYRLREERQRRPAYCPNDGTTLLPGPYPGVLACPFDGWQYPRDWHDGHI